MKKKQFSSLLKSRVAENALIYLKKKIKSKGSEIVYSEIELADYLQPIHPMSIEQKQKLFAIRNRMVQIPDNFSKSELITKCFCGEIEDMKHIYTCNILNEGMSQNEKYENIFNGIIDQQTKIFHKFEENMEKRKTLKNRKFCAAEAKFGLVELGLVYVEPVEPGGSFPYRFS